MTLDNVAIVISAVVTLANDALIAWEKMSLVSICRLIIISQCLMSLTFNLLAEGMLATGEY